MTVSLYTVKTTRDAWDMFEAPNNAAAIRYTKKYYPKATLIYRYSEARWRWFAIKVKEDVG